MVGSHHFRLIKLRSDLPMLLLSLVALCAASPFFSLIPNQYIVVFKTGVSQESFDAHHDWLQILNENKGWKDLLFSDAFEMIHRYHLPSFSGYTARLPAFMLALLKVPPWSM
jgi:hypothetical protein